MNKIYIFILNLDVVSYLENLSIMTNTKIMFIN